MGKFLLGFSSAVFFQAGKPAVCKRGTNPKTLRVFFGSNSIPRQDIFFKYFLKFFQYFVFFFSYFVFYGIVGTVHPAFRRKTP